MLRFLKIILPLFALSALIACSGDRKKGDETRADSNDLSQIPLLSLEQELQIAGFDESGFFGYLTHVFSGPDGIILTADPSSRKIHLFSPDGSYSGHIGGEGAGPGEFRNIADVSMSASGSLYVNDPSLARISVFSGASGEWELDDILDIPFPAQDVSSPMSGPFYMRHLFPAETGYIAEYESSVMYDSDDDSITSCFQMLDDSLQFVTETEPLCSPKYEFMVTRSRSGNSISVTTQGVPENHGQLAAITSGGELIRIHTSEANVTIHQMDGTLINEFSIAAAKIPITNQMKQELAEKAIPNPENSSIRRDALADAIPDYKPLAEQLLTDADNRIWILSRTSEDELVWLIYNRDGELQARADHPGGNFTHITSNRAYAVFNPGDDEPSFGVYRF